MNERRKRMRTVSEDLFVAPFTSQALLIYREGMLPLRIKLSEVEPLIQALRSVADDLVSGAVPPDTLIHRLDD